MTNQTVLYKCWLDEKSFFFLEEKNLTLLKAQYAEILDCHITQNNQPITIFRLDTRHMNCFVVSVTFGPLVGIFYGFGASLYCLLSTNSTKKNTEVSMKPRADGALKDLRLRLFVSSDSDRRDRALIDQLLHKRNSFFYFIIQFCLLCFRFISSCSSFFIYLFYLLCTKDWRPFIIISLRVPFFSLAICIGWSGFLLAYSLECLFSSSLVE